MNAVQQLLTDHIDIWTAAETEKKSGRGRAVGNAASVYGIKKLRELILDLAIRGKLVTQDANDEPASELLTRIQLERSKLITEGKIKHGKTLISIIPVADAPFGLPIRWQWVRLADLFALITDGDHQAPPTSNQGVPFLVIGNLNTGHVSFDSCRFVHEEYYKELDWGKKPAKNDILYTVTGSYGIPIIVNVVEKFCVQRHVAIFKSLKSSPVNYLSCVLGSKYAMQYASEIATGIAQKTVPLTGLREMLVPLPPIAEQHRIVAKVDEMMALCDQLEAQHSNAADAHEQLVSNLLGTLTQSQCAADFNTNWQRIAAHFNTLFTTEASIDTLKQTLLQLAVMGKLVAQDADDEPASELLKRIQAEKAKLIAEGRIKKDKQAAAIESDAKPFALPQNWEWVSFDHIAENSKHALKAGPFGSALKKNMYCENGYKIYGQEQVISGDENLGNYYINEAKFRELSSCAVKSGDILISLVGTIGRVLALSEKCEEGIINPRLVKISLFNEINRYFMKIIFASPLLKNEMANKSHGGTMDILNLGLLRAFALPLPPINEQHRIVTKVDELMEFCDQLKSRITAANQQQKKLADVLVEHAVIG